METIKIVQRPQHKKKNLIRRAQRKTFAVINVPWRYFCLPIYQKFMFSSLLNFGGRSC
jgi:hypothetical protein